MQDFEFTIEEGVVYMLQTRNGKRTAMAALKFSIDMHREKLIDWKTAVMRNPADQLEQLLAPVFDLSEVAKAKVIATGLPAGPGCTVNGPITFSPAAGTVTVPAGSTSAPICVTMTRPAGLTAQNATACFEFSFVNDATGVCRSCTGTLRADNSLSLIHISEPTRPS